MIGSTVIELNWNFHLFLVVSLSSGNQTNEQGEFIAQTTNPQPKLLGKIS